MKPKVVLPAAVVVLAGLSALGQGSDPDLSRSALAGRQDPGAWAQLLPPLLFFVGLALIAGLFLLSEAAKRNRGTPPSGAPPPGFPRRFPRPPIPPPGPKH